MNDANTGSQKSGTNRGFQAARAVSDRMMTVLSL